MNITLIPYAGLCNRLNAISSALAYKFKHPDVGFHIYWHKWYHCNCRFSDLFEQLSSQFIPIQELRYNPKLLPGNKLNLGIPQKMRRLWFDCSILPDSNADMFDELIDGYKNIYILKDNRFCRESWKIH